MRDRLPPRVMTSKSPMRARWDGWPSTRRARWTSSTSSRSTWPSTQGARHVRYADRRRRARAGAARRSRPRRRRNRARRSSAESRPARPRPCRRHRARRSGHVARDVRYALRLLRRAPGFAAAAIVTLALGIGANVAIFSVVRAVVLRPPPYRDPSRVLAFLNSRSGAPGPITSSSLPDFEDWRGS